MLKPPSITYHYMKRKAAATLAPDGTQVGSYRPTSQYLGDLGKGKSIDRGMSLAAMDVPDGGFLALSFVVVNRGS